MPRKPDTAGTDRERAPVAKKKYVTPQVLLVAPRLDGDNLSQGCKSVTAAGMFLADCGNVTKCSQDGS